MKNKSIYTALVFLFFQGNMLAQKKFSYSFNPVQIQYSYADAKHDLVEEETHPWGWSHHPELLVHRELFKNMDLLFGVGFLVKRERIKIDKSASLFFVKAELDETVLPTSDLGKRICRVVFSEAYTTFPLGIRFHFLEYSQERFFVLAKTELGVLNFSHKDAKVYIYDPGDSFAILSFESYERIKGTVAEKRVEEYFERYDAGLIWDTQLGLGSRMLTEGKKDLTVQLWVKFAHLSHRPGMVGKKFGVGMSLGWSF